MKLLNSPFIIISALCSCIPSSAQQIRSEDDSHQHLDVKQIAIIGSKTSSMIYKVETNCLHRCWSCRSSAAYHLYKYADKAGIDINITIVERNDYLGGRSTTVNAYDDPEFPVELGASIFVSVNRILVDAVKEFNLETSKYSRESIKSSQAASLGIYNGIDFVVKLDHATPTWWDTAKILIRYGLAPIRTNRLMKSTITRFLRMYDEPFFPFSNLTATAQQLELTEAISMAGDAYLHANGVADSFASDIVQASTRVNYAQNLHYFHGLETMVCMATDGAMSIKGGNWQIFSRMLEASKARVLLNTSATSIKRGDGGRYALSTENKDPAAASMATDDFDAIIIAAPFDQSNMDITSHHLIPSPVDYVHLHVTLWTSHCAISPSLFNLPPGQLVPSTILTTLQEHEIPTPGNRSQGFVGFFSLSTLAELTNPLTGRHEYLYKMFSASEMSPNVMGSLCGRGGSENDVSRYHKKLWQSYPYETPRTTFDPIELADNLYYTGGMESFISTMETNALMGKNIARLLINKLEADMTGNVDLSKNNTSFSRLDL